MRTQKVNAEKMQQITKQQMVFMKKALKEGSQIPVWDHKKDEDLIGYVVDIKEIKVKKGRKEIKSRLIIINTGDKKLGIWDRHIIADFLDEQKIKKNDLIGIKFLGKVKNYYNYNCYKYDK